MSRANLILAGCLLGFGVASLPAQATSKPQQDPTSKPTSRKAETGKDDAGRAGDILRKKFGLKPVTVRPKEPGTKPATPEQDPDRQQDPASKPASRPVGKPRDDAERAGDALKKAMPGAKPVVKRPPEPKTRPEAGPDQQDPERAARALRGRGTTIGSAAGQTRLVHGSLAMRYRFRDSREGKADQDVLGLLNLNVGDRERHPVTAHFLGDGIWDMDGRSGNSTFSGISESYGDNLFGRVWEAHVDLHDVAQVQTLRLGRQSIYETPVVVSFDGLRLESEEVGDQAWQFGVFGGMSNHLYESSASGDFLAGASVAARPLAGSRLRVDWVHGADDLPGSDFDNDLLSFGAWQKVGRNSNLHGSLTLLDGESRDLRLRGSTYLEDSDLQLQVDYYGLLTTQRAQATEFDPFFAAAFDYSPYSQVRALVSKGFGEGCTLTGGANVRRLRDGGDEGRFNREFERYYLTSSFEDVAAKGLSIDLTGEYWDSDGGEDVSSLGADVSYEFSNDVRSSVGTYYSLYKQDLSDGRERERVRTYYVKLEYRREALRLSVHYEFEDDEDDDYHELEVRVTLGF